MADTERRDIATAPGAVEDVDADFVGRAQVDPDACEFPGCDRRRQEATAPGPAPRYCEDDRHDRKTAYEARKRLARRQRDEKRAAQEPLRDAAAGQVPGPVEMGGLRLRDVAARMVETFEREGQVSREFMDALVETLGDLTDAETVEANLNALKAHHDLELAQVRADLAQREADLRAAQRLAEESSDAAGVLQSLNTSLQERVQDLEPRLADAEQAAEQLGGDLVRVTTERNAALSRAADELEPALAAATAELERLNVLERALNGQVHALTGERDAALAAARAAEQDRDEQVRDAAQAADRGRERAESAAASAADRVQAAEQLRDRADEQTRRADTAAADAQSRAQAAEQRESALRRDLEAQQAIAAEAQRAAADASQRADGASQRADDAEDRVRGLEQRVRELEPADTQSATPKTPPPKRGGRTKT